MATPNAFEETVHFIVKDAPGPFRLVAEEVRSHENRFQSFVVEFTMNPFLQGEKIFGNRYQNAEIRISFEVALKGVTATLGYGNEEPRNVRLLGRFFPGTSNIRSETDENIISFLDELAEWQWEVVFNPQNRKGFVFKLPNPLPREWTT